MRVQIFAMDLVFTGAIFVMLFFMIALMINSTITTHEQAFDNEKRLIISKQLASLLVMSPGYPVTWNETNIEYPGLAYSPNKLDRDKYSMLVGLDYSTLDLEGYNVSLILEEVTPGGYEPLNCSERIMQKYGNCTYTTEQRTPRLFYSDDKVYRVWVVVE